MPCPNSDQDLDPYASPYAGPDPIPAPYQCVSHQDKYNMSFPTTQEQNQALQDWINQHPNVQERAELIKYLITGNAPAFEQLKTQIESASS